MKRISQIGLVLVAVVGLVAGVTYMSFFSGGVTKSASVAPAPKGEKIELDMPERERIVKWDPEYAGEFEIGPQGYHDFWFKNTNSVPLTVGVAYRSCKCSELFISVLSKEETDRFPREAAASVAAEIASASQGMPGFSAMFGDTDPATAWLGAKLPWQPIAVDEANGVTVAPQCGGFFRVAFKGEKVSSARLSINLWSQADTGSPSPRADYRLEIPISFGPVLHVVLPADVSMDELNFGEEKSKEFLCWSASRLQFSLKAREVSNDPCFSCTCTPLTPDECAKASPMVISRVLSGYNVKVTVHERLPDGHQLDWGPFLRKVALTSDPDIEETSVDLRGRVLGEIIVGVDEDKGAIVLGTFKSKQGKSKSIRMTPLQSAVNLQFDRIEPPTLDYIKVKSLTKVNGKGSDWDLCVEAVPGCPPGKLPRNSAVILKIAGPNPRNIRIPIRGLAYQD
jgi:hypothetical protein